MSQSSRADDLPAPTDPLRRQILAAAEAFAEDGAALAAVLSGLVADVDRAEQEVLPIFPVAHHSPSSAVHLVRRLRERPPRAIYMECCEDLRPILSALGDCTLPVALQAFATGSDAFPAAWSPLNLVCPLTEFSAEFQAIAAAMNSPEMELVFVDRSADHVFQWMPQTPEAIDAATPDDPPSDEEDVAMHGSAVGVEVGALVPTFEAFRLALIRNARVRHFSEWWDQYVEEAIIGADYATYRQVMFLIGSLFRRLGTRRRELESDRLRERHMWTRIKEHLKSSGIDPADAIHICGAAHAASDVGEFGLASGATWEIPPRTATSWLYGVLPSSYGAIEHQFGHPRGAVTLAEARWRQAASKQGLKAFVLGTSTRATAPKPRPAAAASDPGALGEYLQAPPPQLPTDDEELVGHCVRIVELARKHGYLATTADGIAIYQTAVLLANVRNRRRPTPYDFRDAAVTCLEKEAVPGKRDVAKLCDLLLGGDKVGKIGFASLPPLAQNVYDRLSVLPITVAARTIQRALLDFRKEPALLPASDVLWMLHRLLPAGVVRPIMGQRELGHAPRQESWDVAIGKHQGSLIQLGYEGITVEHVLERRLKKGAFAPEARTADALRAAEESLLFLRSPRLTEELGAHAVALLVREPDVGQAREIHARVSRLVHHFRATPGGLPDWAGKLVTTGYSHYGSLLPNAFADRGTQPADLAAMLQFIFTLESLALSLGCARSELTIAIRQAGPLTLDAPKLALLWSAEAVLGLRPLTEVRARLDELLDNELTLGSFPDYLEGFLLALAFTPLVGPLTAELLGRAFARLPDHLLMPWLPKLLRMLRGHADAALPTLIKEAAAMYPGKLGALAAWEPPWSRSAFKATATLAPASAGDPILIALIDRHRAATDGIAAVLGLPASWGERPAEVAAPADAGPVAALIAAHGEATAALATLLGA